MTSYLLRGVRPFGGDRTDLLLHEGRIADPSDAPSTVTTVDADGLVALPGLVDLHTHLREPGREDAETVASGSRAAALGGFTAVHAMANTDPVADTAGVVEQVWHLGQAAGYCHVRPVGAVTVGLDGRRLAELGAMADSRARVRVFSDDGICVSDAVLMRRALEYVKAFDGVIAQHAQEPRLTEDAQMNEGTVSGILGMRGWPAVAEEAIIARDCLLAGHVGSRLHICHVSTAGSVELIRWAKGKGWDVTAEVTPHHLLLTDQLVASYDPIYKVNPPLRTADDVAALRAGLADGTIDCVATDHAPHPDRGQGVRVGGRGDGDARVGDSTQRRPGGDGRDRFVGLVGSRRQDVGPSGADRQGRRARTSAGAWRRGPPDVGRSRHAPGDRSPRVRVVVPQHPIHGPRPAGSGGRHVPRWPGHGPRREVAVKSAAEAMLVLEDGRVFRGASYGAAGETIGEAVFSTAMTGYQETLTDPSYHGQVVVMTAPHVGNTGVNPDDAESSRIWVAGYVVRDPARIVSSWRATSSLDAELTAQGVVGISGIDTRALTRHLREQGAMRVGISTTETDERSLLDRIRAAPRMEGADLARDVSTSRTYRVPPVGPARFRVAAVDLGVKSATLDHLARRGVEVVVLPATVTLDEVVALGPRRGVLLKRTR